MGNAIAYGLLLLAVLALLAVLLLGAFALGAGIEAGKCRAVGGTAYFNGELRYRLGVPPWGVECYGQLERLQ